MSWNSGYRNRNKRMKGNGTIVSYVQERLIKGRLLDDIAENSMFGINGEFKSSGTATYLRVNLPPPPLERLDRKRASDSRR